MPSTDALIPVVGSDNFYSSLRRRRDLPNRSWTTDQKWLIGFVLMTCVLQLALVPGFMFPVRTPLRVALFAASIAMVLAPLRGRVRLPITRYATLISWIFALELLHPYTNRPWAGVAALFLNFAILAPAFWVSRLRLRESDLKALLMVLLGFQLLSTAYGVLEVVWPSVFSRESQIAVQNSEFAESLRITLADGTRIYRPMGLTDTPGGACRSGFFAVMLGSCFLFLEKRIWLRLILVAGIVGGMFCIYMTQVRSVLVLVVVCELVVIGMFVRRGHAAKAVFLGTLLVSLAAAATIWAFAVGGSQISDRVKTLGEGSASNVYYKNRGVFLEDTIINQIPTYPLGAGLGRWGMVNLYFGTRTSIDSLPLWVEIQSTGWLFDGGLPLVVIYYAAIFVCCKFAYRTAMVRPSTMGVLAVVVLAYDISILANTLSYPPFIGQAGLDFWLLNASLMTVVRCEDRGSAVRVNLA